MFYLDLS